MKLLKSRKAFVMWMNANFGYPIPEPDKYPCFAYSIVTDWGMQESQPVYLYLYDVLNMKEQLEKAV